MIPPGCKGKAHRSFRIPAEQIIGLLKVPEQLHFKLFGIGAHLTRGDFILGSVDKAELAHR